MLKYQETQVLLENNINNILLILTVIKQGILNICKANSFKWIKELCI